MGYESELLPSYRGTRNRSCPIIKKTILISGSLYRLYHVLVLLPYESTIPQNIHRPYEKLIYGLAGNLCRNGGLLLLNALLYGPYTFYLQGVCHWGPFPISIQRTPIHINPNMYGHRMVEDLQNL